MWLQIAHAGKKGEGNVRQDQQTRTQKGDEDIIRFKLAFAI